MNRGAMSHENNTGRQMRCLLEDLARLLCKHEPRQEAA